MDWKESNSYLKGLDNQLKKLPDPIRIASFDLDDTLISRPTRRRESKNKWKLLDNSLVQRMNRLNDEGYLIIIFTNQSGMGSSKTFDKPQWRRAMDDLVKIITSEMKKPYYIAVYVAKAYDLYRKPNIGLWCLMKDEIRQEFDMGGLRISNLSFYCGDAAGRVCSDFFRKQLYPTGKKGDHSDVDRKFALNVGIRFITPEEFYKKNSNSCDYVLSGFNPKEYMKIITNKKLTNNHKYQFEPRRKELIIMVGPPGTGKSSFVKKYIVPQGYVHISRDICRSQITCLATAEKAFEEKKSVVVDNTNPDIKSRFDYISLARKYKYTKIRALIMKTDLSLAKHLNNVRHVYSDGTIPRINNIVYNIFRKSYIEPQDFEGFDKIEHIEFTFDRKMLRDPKWKTIFLRYSESQ